MVGRCKPAWQRNPYVRSHVVMWHEVNVVNDVSFEEATKEVRVLATPISISSYQKHACGWIFQICRDFNLRACVCMYVCHFLQHRRDAGRSKEEIERLTVNEDLGDLERACLFLASNAHPVSKQPSLRA